MLVYTIMTKVIPAEDTASRLTNKFMFVRRHLQAMALVFKGCVGGREITRVLYLKQYEFRITVLKAHRNFRRILMSASSLLTMILYYYLNHDNTLKKTQ